MIKKYLIITFLFISIYNYSQENKNKVMINGNFNYTSRKKRPSTVHHSTYYNSKGTIDLNIGYFLIKNFAIGISGGYQKEVIHREYSITETSSEIHYSSGIFTRYNCMTKSRKFGFLFQINSNVYVNEWRMKIKDGNITTNENEKTNGMNIIFTPGIIYFLNHRLSVETSVMNIAYDKSIIKDDLSNRGLSSNFSTNFSPSSFYVGFSYYFGGKTGETIEETQ
jgi:hypothetical protein